MLICGKEQNNSCQNAHTNGPNMSCKSFCTYRFLCGGTMTTIALIVSTNGKIQTNVVTIVWIEGGQLFSYIENNNDGKFFKRNL